MKKSYILLLFMGFTLPSLPAYAHDDWIEPAAFTYEQTVKARLPYTMGFTITASDSYFHPDRNRLLEDVGGFRLSITAPDGSPVMPLFLMLGKTDTQGEALLTQPGTYVLSLTRTDGPVYYSELTYPSGKGVEYVTLPKDKLSADQLKRWKETKAYYHNSKTYVVSEHSSDSWKKPLGHLKEIVPLSDPSQIRKGKAFSVQVLFKGVPYKQATIKLIHQGDKSDEDGGSPLIITADGDGKAVLRFGRAGRWLVETDHYEDNADKTKAGKTKYAATLMVEVGE